VQLLHHLFHSAAERWPNNIAVDVPPGPSRSSRRTISYAQLSRDADAIASQLGRPHDAERIVAIMLPRDSHLLYAAQLAVLRAGAAYVCLDPSHPVAHMAHIARDSGAVCLLTTKPLMATATAAIAANRVLDVASLLRDPPSGNGAQLRSINMSSGRLAYLVYTSGTTGQPKGVMIEHAGVVNLINSGVERFGMQPGDRVAQNSSAAYDSSVEETWLALASGATVVVLDDEAVRSGPDLAAWLRDERITVFCPPPTLLRAMDCSSPAEMLPDLRLVYAGGEQMPQDLADRWSRRIWLENGYGPTECSVTVVRGRLREGEPVCIGEAVPHNSAYVLNESLSEVGEGESGELCIGGVGLARGYLNQPELTAQRFVQHPQLGRIYRTGDIVKRNGGVNYLGRIDSLV
jgi:amino acid adenylation domain-containing protein